MTLQLVPSMRIELAQETPGYTLAETTDAFYVVRRALQHVRQSQDWHEGRDARWLLLDAIAAAAQASVDAVKAGRI